MSGKRAKKVRNSKKLLTKKTAAICAGFCLSTVPLVADGEFLVSVYPHISKPFGNAHNIEYGIGAGLKLTYRPIKFFNVYASGDYYSLSLPNVSPITLIDGGVGIGYHLGISDRLAMDFNVNGGVYNAKMKKQVQSFYIGGELTFTYKINPIVYTDVNVHGAHYASGSSPLMPINMALSPGVTFNLTEVFKGSQKVKVQEKSMDPVFPVLYSWYENNSFGKVQITNEEDSSITDVTVSFYQPQYMGQPKVCSTVKKMAKDESIDVDLYAFFNEQMLELTEKTNTQAIVTVNYSCLGQKRTKAFDITVPVYGRNNMSWDDDRRAAVFVSSKDPAAMLFAKYVTSIVRDNVRNGVPINIQYAMGIFETLDQFGLNYVIDPTSAFEDNVGTSSIDFLQFPYQTLMYRGGDCDDISILVSSLFEAVGIRTAFITIPGHIYMAFDSGLTTRQAVSQFSSLKELIVLDNEVWVPLEITLTDEGFNKAWRVGAREWNTANAAGAAAIYKMEDSWKTYQPISVPGANSYYTLPDETIVSKLFDHSVDEWISREIEPQIKMYQAKLAVKDDVKTRNNLGVLYGKYGLFIQADNEFKQARRKGYTPSIINTGNIYFSRQNYTLARKWYKSVLKDDPNNTLALIGVARCDYELADYNECDAAYNKVMQLNPDLANEYSYLGSFVYSKGRSFSLADRLSKTVWDSEEDEVPEKVEKIVKTQRPLGENESVLDEVPISESMVDDIFDFDIDGVAVVPKNTLEEDDEDYEHLEEESELEGGDPPPEPEFVDETPENIVEEIDLSSFTEDFNGLASEVTIEIDNNLESLEKAAAPVIAATPKIEIKTKPVETKVVEKVETKPTTVEQKEEQKEETKIENKTTNVVTEVVKAVAETTVAAAEIVAETAKVAAETTTVAVVSETTKAAVETTAVVVETTPAAVEVAKTVTEPPKVTAEETPAVVTETTPVVTEVPEVVVETPAEVIETPAVVTKATPVVTETAPVVTESPVVTEIPAQVIEAPAVETETAPVVIETPAEVIETPEVVVETPVEVTETPVSIAEAEYEDEEEFYEEEFIEELDLDELLAQEEELNTIPEPVFVEPENKTVVQETETKLAEVTEVEKETTEPEIENVIEETEIASTENNVAEPETVSETPETEVAEPETFVTLITQDVVEEEIIPVAVPRFTEQPSAEWAPEEAYIAETIPGMKSYEEEMGEYQNDKSFLYEEEITLNTDPDHDVDEIKTDKNANKYAMAGIPDVDPFSSYLSKEDAKVVSKITNFSIEKVQEEAKIIAKNQVEAVSNKIETVNEVIQNIKENVAETVSDVVSDNVVKTIADNVVETVVENITENIAEKAVEVVKDNITEKVTEQSVKAESNVTDKVNKTEPNIVEKTNKIKVGGIIGAVVIALSSVIAAVAVKRSKKEKKGENK